MIDTSNCTEYFNIVSGYAKDLGEQVAANLQKQLDYLGSYACKTSGNEIDPERTRCILYSDFAPLSFQFTMQKRTALGDYVDWFNGGLIFWDHADNDHDHPHWTVHT